MEEREIPVLRVAIVKTQTIALIAELIKCKQNDFVFGSKDQDIAMVKQYSDCIIETSSEISQLISSYLEENFSKQGQ
jgi:predicted nucleotidyltransferase